MDLSPEISFPLLKMLCPLVKIVTVLVQSVEKLLEVSNGNVQIEIAA
jgi:hypothetical protein